MLNSKTKVSNIKPIKVKKKKKPEPIIVIRKVREGEEATDQLQKEKDMTQYTMTQPAGRATSIKSI